MAEREPGSDPKPRRHPVHQAASAREAREPTTLALVHASVLEEAARAGLLAGERSAHVSFRAPPALVEAAKHATGIASTSELCILALVMLAQPDLVAEFMRRTQGRLGLNHTLEY